MLFKRRKSADWWERLRTLVWPRRSFWRSAKYFVKRALRLSGTPHAIAAGVAAGAFSSFTPFLGFHFILAGVLAWVVRGNLIASAIGTAVGNPITFPFIWGATLEAGRFILYGRHTGSLGPMHIGEPLWSMHFTELWEPFLKPMAVGSLPVGLPVALILYFVTRWAVVTFRMQRRRLLAERARRRAAAQSYGANTAASS